MASWLRKGAAGNKRRKDKNFYAENAQKRMKEILPAFHNRLDNALAVNSHEVIIFKQNTLGVPCTCTKFDSVEMEEYKEEVPQEHDTPPIVTSEHSPFSGIGVTLPKNNLFGNRTETLDISNTQSEKEFELSEFAENASIGLPSQEELANMDAGLRSIYEDNLMSGDNVTCGVCYQTGHSPGFTAIGWMYSVLDATNFCGINYYHKDVAEHPARFEGEMDIEDRFVAFKIVVPEFFKQLVFSVRDNTELVQRSWIYALDGDNKEVRLDYAYLDAHRGKEIRIHVKEPNFTHVQIAFDLGLDPILANVSEESETLNYDMESTVGNLTLVLPPRVGLLSAGDIIYMPKRNYTLKVTDAPRKQTVDRVKTEWLVTTRTTQPAEAIKYIHKGYTIKKPFGAK